MKVAPDDLTDSKHGMRYRFLVNCVGTTTPIFCMSTRILCLTRNVGFRETFERCLSKVKIAVVMPAYKSEATILGVLSEIPSLVTNIYVVDDGCPHETGMVVEKGNRDRRVQVIYNGMNTGVGGATIAGFREAISAQCDIIVKLDSDGQMLPSDIERLVRPLVEGTADYTKGNRFHNLEDLREMPKMRIVGNAMLSLMNKFSSGYWSINDPTNGFIAMVKGVAVELDFDKVSQRWFFESDMLFRLSILRAVVQDIPIRSRYRGERSNLRISGVVFEFARKHFLNLHKRIFYLYYLREWGLVSFQLPIAIVLLITGGWLGISFWIQGIESSAPATAGQVMLSVLPLVFGVQLLISCLNFDVTNEPNVSLQKLTGG